MDLDSKKSNPVIIISGVFVWLGLGVLLQLVGLGPIFLIISLFLGLVWLFKEAGINETPSGLFQLSQGLRRTTLLKGTLIVIFIISWVAGMQLILYLLPNSSMGIIFGLWIVWVVLFLAIVKYVLLKWIQNMEKTKS